MSQPFDFHAHLQRQREFSELTFGPGSRIKGVIDHIRRELVEIEEEPAALHEWIDVVILALDGALRAGHSPDAIINGLVMKQTQNEARSWPDWRTAPPDQAITHIKPKTTLDIMMDAIRAHRDAKGDDRCWRDDEELYQVLPEGYTPPARDTTVELQYCERYIACRLNPATEYISPQRRIEELERRLAKFGA